MSLTAYSNYKTQRTQLNKDTNDVRQQIISEQPSDPFCLCISDGKLKNLWVIEVNMSALKDDDVTIHGPAFHFVFGKVGVSANDFVNTYINHFAVNNTYTVTDASHVFDNPFKELTKIEVYGTKNGTSTDGYLTLANILKNNTLDNTDDYDIVALPKAASRKVGALVALIMSEGFTFLTYDNHNMSCIAGNFGTLT